MGRDYVYQKVRQHRILHDVSIELTYNCNLKCFFCYNDVNKKGTPLSLRQYSRLFEDLQSMETMHIMLTGGEPMIHPEFFKIGEITRDLGFVTRIRTNGHNLTRKNARRLRQEVEPYAVEVSLHGATAAIHDKQTRVQGSFERLVRNIRNGIDAGLRVQAVTTPTLWNEQELPAMLELTRDIGIPLRFQGPVAPRDNGDLEPLSITPSDNAWRFLDAEHQASRQQYLEDKNGKTKYSPLKLDEEPASTCSVGVAGVDIDPFGNVQACIHLQESAGSLHERSIKEIWNDSPLFVRARQRALDAAKQFEDKPVRQMGASVYCLAVEENMQKGSSVKVDLPKI